MVYSSHHLHRRIMDNNTVVAIAIICYLLWHVMDRMKPNA